MVGAAEREAGRQAGSARVWFRIWTSVLPVSTLCLMKYEKRVIHRHWKINAKECDEIR
jgi:hypothetical protein